MQVKVYLVAENRMEECAIEMIQVAAPDEVKTVCSNAWNIDDLEIGRTADLLHGITEIISKARKYV